jgi:uncharacterized membrane protein
MPNIGLLLMSALYLWSGINHFRKPNFYLKMMPPYLPNHLFLVNASGVAEIVLAIGLLFSATQSLAAWGIIALLIAVFPANIYMLTATDRFRRIPTWFKWLRLPLQGALIWWAWQYV